MSTFKRKWQDRVHQWKVYHRRMERQHNLIADVNHLLHEYRDLGYRRSAERAKELIEAELRRLD